MTLFIHLGQFLALEGQYNQLSVFEKIVNLFFFPVVLQLWQMLTNIVSIIMTSALAQKLMEKLEKVPEKGIDIWIKDCLTLFNAFEKPISLFCLFVMTCL